VLHEVAVLSLDAPPLQGFDDRRIAQQRFSTMPEPPKKKLRTSRTETQSFGRTSQRRFVSSASLAKAFKFRRLATKEEWIRDCRGNEAQLRRSATKWIAALPHRTPPIISFQPFSLFLCELRAHASTAAFLANKGPRRGRSTTCPAS
jgi:hypothetical protein